MPYPLRLLASRFIFVVMLATYLSPAFGWAMTASHDELEHASFTLSSERHDHDHDSPAGHEHQEPHSYIGHLLSHLAASASAEFKLKPAPRANASFADLLVVVPFVAPETPFRPPRPSFLSIS